MRANTIVFLIYFLQLYYNSCKSSFLINVTLSEDKTSAKFLKWNSFNYDAEICIGHYQKQETTSRIICSFNTTTHHLNSSGTTNVLFQVKYSTSFTVRLTVYRYHKERPLEDRKYYIDLVGHKHFEENSTKTKFKLILLGNENSRLKMSGVFSCAPNYYGNHCSKGCVPDDGKTYCDKDGEKHCISGMGGKRGGCYMPCIEGCDTTCTNEENCICGDGSGLETTCEHGICSKNSTCICSRGYKGPNCEMKDRCYPNPCKNGGKCREDGSCNCKSGYSGKRCQNKRLKCQNGSIENEKCICDKGFHGKLCDKKFFCDNVDCNNGNCEEKENGYVCVCNKGFTGSFCSDPQININVTVSEKFNQVEKPEAVVSLTSVHIFILVSIIAVIFFSLLVIIVCFVMGWQRSKRQYAQPMVLLGLGVPALSTQEIPNNLNSLKMHKISNCSEYRLESPCKSLTCSTEFIQNNCLLDPNRNSPIKFVNCSPVKLQKTSITLDNRNICQGLLPLKPSNKESSDI